MTLASKSIANQAVYQTFGHRMRRAFTVVELHVSIGILVVLAGIFVPSFRESERRAQRITLESALRSLSLAAQDYRRANDTFPSTTQLGESGLLEGRGFEWDDEEIRYPNLDYCFVVESADANEYVLCAYPKPPHRDGSLVLCIEDDLTFKREIFEEPPDEEAVAEDERRLQQAQFRMLEGAARIFVLAEDQEVARLVLPYLETLDSQAVLSSALDQDQDGLISRGETDAFSQPQPGDTAIFSEVRATFRDVSAILHVDRQTVYDVSVSLDDLQGDPATLFDAENINAFIDVIVAKAGVANALKVKVVAAQKARQRGDWEEAAEIVESLRSQLSAQAGKSIAFHDAALLKGLSIVLAPAAPVPDEEE